MENTENKFETRIDLTSVSSASEKIKAEIGKIVVGQKKMIEQFLVAVLANGHVLVEGVPGIAKTLTSKLIAKSISAKFSRIQFTPDLMPSDVLGTSVFNMSNSKFEFNAGPIFANLVLIDEINRAPAKTQSALFEVMEERQVTIEGNTYKMEKPFIVFATQNPIDQEGTYKLPEAQLDRFVMKILVDYPTLEEECQILANVQGNAQAFDIDKFEAIVTAEEIIEAQQKVREVHVDENLWKYIAQIVNKTRNNNSLYLGASPRASLAILATSKAHAALHGRDFVMPEDIKEMVFPVLRHRVILTPEKEMEGITAEQIIKQIVDSIEVPR